MEVKNAISMVSIASAWSSPIAEQERCKRQVRPQTLRDDKFPALPIQTSSGEHQFRIIVEILHVGVGQLRPLPTHSLSRIEESNASTNKAHKCTCIGNRCRSVDWHTGTIVALGKPTNEKPIE